MANNFELVIPAAGLGTRSGLPYPKGLHEIDGKPIVRRIIEALCPKRTILIVNPTYLEQWSHQFPDCDIRVQLDANGPAQAVKIGLQAMHDEYGVVVWGDMLRPSVFDARRIMYRMIDGAYGVVPVAYVPNPYTLVITRDALVWRVDETRESGRQYAAGWRDIGMFGVRKDMEIGTARQFLPLMIGSETFTTHPANALDFNEPSQLQSVTTEQFTFETEGI